MSFDLGAEIGLRRFHVDLAENWIERLIDTRGFHGKGLLFYLYSDSSALLTRAVILTQIKQHCLYFYDPPIPHLLLLAQPRISFRSGL